MGLLVARGVHEVMVLAVAVEVLHLLLVEHRALDDVFRAQALFRGRLVAQVPGLDPDEAAQVAGRLVLEIEDAEQVARLDDDHAALESGGGQGVCHRSALKEL